MKSLYFSKLFSASPRPERPEPVQRVEWVKMVFVYDLFWTGVVVDKIFDRFDAYTIIVYND
jgi:hypothetical protein